MVDNKYLNKTILQQVLKNGETQTRSFLIYSPNKKILDILRTIFIFQRNLSIF